MTPPRHRKPSPQKRAATTSPDIDKAEQLWIRDIAGKATFYPSTKEKFQRLQNRLISEGKKIITSERK